MGNCFGYALIWFLLALVVLFWLPMAFLMPIIGGLVMMAALFL